jgi:hypothetical protein
MINVPGDDAPALHADAPAIAALAPDADAPMIDVPGDDAPAFDADAPAIAALASDADAPAIAAPALDAEDVPALGELFEAAGAPPLELPRAVAPVDGAALEVLAVGVWPSAFADAWATTAPPVFSAPWLASVPCEQATLHAATLKKPKRRLRGAVLRLLITSQ